MAVFNYKITFGVIKSMFTLTYMIIIKIKS